MGDEDKERQAESRRILERVAREVEGEGVSARMTTRRDAGAEDADNEDWAEYWGTRIGRSLGVVLLIGLLIWLTLELMRG
jgi:hypothetical protein